MVATVKATASIRLTFLLNFPKASRAAQKMVKRIRNGRKRLRKISSTGMARMSSNIINICIFNLITMKPDNFRDEFCKRMLNFYLNEDLSKEYRKSTSYGLL